MIEHDFTPAQGFKQRLSAVMRLAVPGAATMMSYTVVGVVDTLLVGHLGAESLGAVGLANTLFFTFLSFGLGLVHGSTALIAQSVGARRFGDGGRYYHHAQYVALGMGLLITLALSLPGALWFDLMGPEAGVRELGVSYLAIRAMGAPFLLMIVGRDGLMEGLGDARTPFKISLVINLVNGVLDLWLINGGLGLAPMGVVGAAWASNIAQALAVVIYAGVLRRVSRSRPNLGLWPYKMPSAKHSRKLMGIGWPMGTQYLADIGGWMLVSMFLGWMGSAALAASQIVIRCIHPVLMASKGATIAATTLVGQSLGAGDRRSARSYGFMAVGSGGVLALVATLPGLFFADVLVGIFTTDPEVITLGTTMMRIALILMVTETVANSAYGMLQGAGDTRFALGTNLVMIWGVGVPLAYALGFWTSLGGDGVFYALGLQMGGVAFIYGLRLRGTAWLESYKPEESVEDSSKLGLLPTLEETPELATSA